MRWDELRDELIAMPGVREEIERLYPYRQLAVEVNGARADLDMTQTEFGRLVGIPQSSVARLESGQQNPSVGMLQRIARATGTELVIELRPPERTRRATAAGRKATPTADPQPARRVAASAGD